MSKNLQTPAPKSRSRGLRGRFGGVLGHLGPSWAIWGVFGRVGGVLVGVLAIFYPGPARLPRPVPAARPGAGSPAAGPAIWYSGILVFRYSEHIPDGLLTES